MRQPLRRVAVAAFAGVVAGFACVAATTGSTATAAPSAVFQATGPLLLDEDFTGATAIPEFTGYGTACLTGAPTGATGPGEHPLVGCPPQGTPPAAFAALFPISPPLGAAPNGYLRLTDALPDQSGAVLYDTPIQATDGVEITFDMWQYGGYSTIPAFPNVTADGISFFLVDATATLDAPGAFGGSLGYASKLPDDNPANAVVPGVAGGYLGFGFDVLGNFYGDWEQRGAGCPAGQQSPAGNAFLVPAPGANMVTVRGPVGADQTLGYCWLAATATGPNASTLPPGNLHGSTTGPVTTDPAAAVTALEPSRRTVTMLFTPEPVHTITVSIDFHDGRGVQEVLTLVAPEPVPPAVKFGFAASTGAFTDVHLIRTLRMQAVDPVPALSFVKSVAPVNPAGDVAEGAQLRYTFEIANTGGGAIDDIAINDPRIPDIDCPATTLAEGASMSCTALYVITAADVAAGTVVNTASVGGTGRGGPLDPIESTAEVSLVALAASGVSGPALAASVVAVTLLIAVGGVLLIRSVRPRGG